MSKSVACLLFFALIGQGWNAVGHRAVAGHAYDRLKKTARHRVDDLIRKHPDYQLLVAGATGNNKERARYAFMSAAVWPDTIKGDPRFYDESRRDAKPTPVLAGFPDMQQRRNWHYINKPFSPDGTPLLKPPVPNALTQLHWIIERIGNKVTGEASVEDPVYLLPWLMHVGGDEFQPLHCVTRFRKGQLDRDGKPMGDLGGNTVILLGGQNLHAYWDDSLGGTPSPTYVEAVIKQLRKQDREKKPILEPAVWIEEGLAIAKRDVYSFGVDGGTKEDPVKLDDHYKIRSRKIALQRAALGGQRLAALLNEKLR
ncbi:MAG: S1/P1 nuclease [Acidobacteriia bacterium]|nr:S1/P1 nuclease [Terriglobia bacterium]